MKKLMYLIVLALILGLVLTGCSLLSNIGQAPATQQSGISFLTKSPSPGLVGLWHLDEGTGTTATDSSGKGNNGTLYNFVPPHGWVSGMFGQALSFDGIDDYVDCGSNVGSFNLSNPFSIEAWINPALNNENNVIYGNAWAEPGYHVRVTLENKVRFILIQTGSIYKGIDSSVLTAGWHHIAAVWNGTSVKIYVDGEDDSQIAIENGTVTTITTTANTKFGLDTAPAAHYFNGLIDEVRIWDEALTVDQIGDISPPVVTINAPDNGGFYPVGAVPACNYTVVDANSYTVEETGCSIDEGMHTYTVTATDVLGYVGSASVTYYVLENFVTGGGKIDKSTLGLPGKGVALTFAGTIGVLEGEGIVGQFQIVDHTGFIRKGAVSWHCNNEFSFLNFVGDPAESPEATHDTAIFEGEFVSNLGDTQTLKFQIIDNGEPGTGVDTFSIWFFDDWLGWTIDGGNFQVHDIE